MKVLVVTGEYPSARKPFRASFNRQHLNALAAHHQIEIVCPVAWTDWLKSRDRGADFRAPDSIAPGIKVHFIPYWYPPGVLRSQYDTCLWYSTRKLIARILSTFQPDLLLGIWGFPDGAVALRAARSAGLPVAVQVLGSDVNLLSSFPAKKAKTVATLTAVDRVLTVSHALRDRVIALGAAEERVRVVYRGVNAALFTPRDQGVARQGLGLDEDKQHLLFIGNLVSVKNPLLLLDAYARAPTDRMTQLHIIGDGPLRGELASRAASLAAGKSVVFHGVVAHGDIPRWMAAVDLLVLSSDEEGVPNVLLEARSLGCPYVATRVGGVPEISTHDGARLVTRGSVEEMAAALGEALEVAVKVRTPKPWQSWSEAGAALSGELERVHQEFASRAACG